MAANGTPQGYLYNKRPSTDTTRDRSMEQYYSNTGNPYGYNPGVPNGATPNNNNSYVPQGSMGRYTPPQVQGGQWGAQAFAPGPSSYYLPQANGTGTNPSNQQTPGYVPPPGGSTYMPNFQSFGQALGAAQGQGQPATSQQQQFDFNAQLAQQQQQLAGGMAANYTPQGGGLSAGPQNTNVSQMMQQFAAQHQPPAAGQPMMNPALNNPAYSGLQRSANFVPQNNPQGLGPNNPQGPAPNPIASSDPRISAYALLGGFPQARSYAPIGVR